MVRKKGIYDLVFYKTKASPETLVSGVNFKQAQDRLISEYKDFINVKDEAHTTEPFLKIVTSSTLPPSKSEKEEYFYTKKK